MVSEQEGTFDVPEEGQSEGSAEVVHRTAGEVDGDRWLGCRREKS